MATRFFGLNRGEGLGKVTEAAATTSKKIELAVDLSSNLTAMDVYNALTLIKNYVLSQSRWPPA